LDQVHFAEVLAILPSEPQWPATVFPNAPYA
jgi:hypothetical protein